MTCAHIGHDSQVGSHCILANAATLAGHVIIEDYVTLGAFCPVHQHCIVGKYAFVGGGTIVTQDVLPFSLTCIAARKQGFRHQQNRSCPSRFLAPAPANAAKSLPTPADVEDEHHPGPRKAARDGW